MYQSPTLVPVNVIRKVFIDVIKMRSYQIRMGPESLGKREIWTHGRKPHGDRAEIRAM